MAERILLTEDPRAWTSPPASVTLLHARDYIASTAAATGAHNRVINFCRSYRYLSVGYHCSLLAEARGDVVIPSIRTLADLRRPSLYRIEVEDLDGLVQRSLGRLPPQSQAPRLELMVYFGRSSVPELQDLARQIFETFPCPTLRVEFRLKGSWRIQSIWPVPLQRLSIPERGALDEALERYLVRRRSDTRPRPRFRYDIAMLHDPREAMPPSNERALKRFIAAGRARGVNVEPIGRQDYGRLPEYDALFIRETTRIDHHTYRFARRAESEDMVVIDDPTSILRCTNKIYLDEVMRTHRIPTPNSVILGRANLLDAEHRIGYPVVLKIPDSSFSLGVLKAENRRELESIGERMLRESDLILAQEYLYTDFDWRVGLLGGHALYVCRYYMSRKHWQIYDYSHSRGGQPRAGNADTLTVEDAPAELVETALRAGNAIGDGLYGVDLKQTERGPVVIEINDNPSIDAGVEDAVLGMRLYLTLVEEFVARLDAQWKPTS